MGPDTRGAGRQESEGLQCENRAAQHKQEQEQGLP